MNKPQDNQPQGERLQKKLATSGFGSRREIERWITEGRLKINGKLATLGDRVTEDDVISLDNKPLSSKRLASVQRRVIMYNKPEGELVTRSDPEGRKTVFSRLPRLDKGRWVAIGRLDINSAGLLIFSTDGELANRLMHPAQQIEREYAVRVMGEVTDEILNELVNGKQLEDGFARFEDIVESGGEGINRWFHVVIMEGRKREVRRLWESVGLKVNRLKRVRFGSVILDSSVKVGQWRELDHKETEALLELAGLGKDKAVKKPEHRNSVAKDKSEKKSNFRKKSPWKKASGKRRNNPG